MIKHTAAGGSAEKLAKDGLRWHPSPRATRVDALLNPRNVVILGATDKRGNWAERVWRNLRRYGFGGPIYPVNPARDSVWDTRCYRTVADLPEAPDHAVVLIPAPHVPDAIRQLAGAGARSATVMSAGFGEAIGPAAQDLAARLQAAIDETGLAVSGPNCLGNLDARASLVTMPDDRPQRLALGPVAIVGQSGGIAMAIKRTLEERGTDTTALVTSGNETGLTTADYIDYFAEAPHIRVIVSYLEAVRDPTAFLAACRRARAAGKPVVVLKLGASDSGRAAAMAHTGALAGSMDAFDAVAGEAGALRVRTLDDIVEAVEYLAHVPLPRGGGLGAVTFSGGMRGLLLDAAHANGLRFADLAPETDARLRQILTVGSAVGNPLDAGFTALASPEAYIQCVEALLGDPGIDILLLQEELPRGPGTERKEANLRAVDALAERSSKPIAYVTMISHGLTDYSRELRATLPRVAFLQEMDKSLRTLAPIIRYAAQGHRIATLATARASSPPSLEELHVAPGIAALDEVRSKKLLARYGIRGPREEVAASADQAVEIAERLGYPVVAKALSSDLPHKSDVGGVVVGIASADAVRGAYRQISEAIAAHPNQPGLDGVLIAEQVSGGLELLLGASRDPEMGPIILFGSGGLTAELMRDVAVAAAPLDEERALALIERTRAGALVAGYRGAPALDQTALVKALVGISNLMLDADKRIDSIDVNPFILQRSGGIALDALIVLGELR